MLVGNNKIIEVSVKVSNSSNFKRTLFTDMSIDVIGVGTCNNENDLGVLQCAKRLAIRKAIHLRTSLFLRNEEKLM